MKYIVLLRGSLADWKNLPEGESNRLLSLYREWVSMLKEEDYFVSGSPLNDESWFFTQEKQEVNVEGPVSGQTTLTGYFILEASDSATVVGLVKRCPALVHGESVEMYHLGEH